MSAIRAHAIVLLVLPFVFASASCLQSSAGSDGGGGGFCERAAQKMRRCGLLTEGDIRCEEPNGDLERCAAQCLLETSCDTLVAAECDDDDSAQQVLERCLDGCLPRFTCASGQRVPEQWACDGEADCIDGSDERDCPTLTCGSGESLPESWACDGYPDCIDGSDESACPGRFSCGSGDTVPSVFQCDGDRDCADGSDEDGCPTFSCGSGVEIPADRRCDQDIDCPGGDDEDGCAMNVCPDGSRR